MSLINKTAIITGCSKGIGFATLKHLSSKLDKIFACVRKIDDNFINALSKFKNQNVIPIEFDLNDRDEIKKAIDKIKFKIFVEISNNRKEKIKVLEIAIPPVNAVAFV